MNNHPILTEINTKLDQIIRRVDDILITKKEKYSPEEAAVYLNISKSTLYKLTSSGEITYSKPNGKKIRFNKEDLDTWDNRGRIPSKYEIEKEVINISARSKSNRT